MTFTTTLTRIREMSKSLEGWRKLLRHLGKTAVDDEPLAYSTILECNGFNDALLCCLVEPKYDKYWRLFAVFCANQVRHLMTDEKSTNAIDVAERHANGMATDKELLEAYEAAEAAANYGAGNAASSAASLAASLAAIDAAWYAAFSTASAAAKAAARDETSDEAWDATMDRQAEEFLRIVNQEVQL